MRREFRVILFTQFLLFAPCGVSGDAVVRGSENCNVHSDLSSLQNRDPQRDADAAIRGGRPVFLGAYGYALVIPGVEADAYCMKDAGLLQIIPDTGDDLRCEAHARAVEVGLEYAGIYNEYLLSKSALLVPAQCAA